MNEAAPRRMHLALAIPDSCLSDDSTHLDKSRKISSIARAAAIFSVDEILLYRDGGKKADASLLSIILRYMETPPFLRRQLFSRVNDLKYAGVLHALNIPSHTVSGNPKDVRAGDVREGIVVARRGKKFVDVGIGTAAAYRGEPKIGRRVTVLFERGFPDLVARQVPRSEAPSYWGYAVRERGSLSGIIREWPGRCILTSRLGRPVSAADIRGYAREPRLLLAFGSTDKGIHDILGGEIKRIQNARTLNFFPSQSTRTVRVEEAVLGVLSILNAGRPA